MGRMARKIRRKHRRSIVRRVTLTADQFDNFLFPVWANAQNPGDSEVVIRITKKLKKASSEVPLNKTQQAARDAGKRVYADRTLDHDSYDFMFEEDERNVLRDAFKKALGNFNPLAMEDAFDIYEIIRTAPDADDPGPAEPEFEVTE